MQGPGYARRKCISQPYACSWDYLYASGLGGFGYARSAFVLGIVVVCGCRFKMHKYRSGRGAVFIMSLSLSLSHTHTHTHTTGAVCSVASISARALGDWVF